MCCYHTGCLSYRSWQAGSCSDICLLGPNFHQDWRKLSHSNSNKSHLVNGTRDSDLAQQCPATVTGSMWIDAHVVVLFQLVRHKKNNPSKYLTAWQKPLLLTLPQLTIRKMSIIMAYVWPLVPFLVLFLLMDLLIWVRRNLF